MSHFFKEAAHVGALAAGGVLLWRQIKYNSTQKLHAKSSEGNETENAGGMDKSRLKLKQVQVIFRHGARTPIHTLPKHNQVNYDYRFFKALHPATLFPYERVSASTGEPIEWGHYQKYYEAKTLQGGSYPGMLSSYGQDQMLMLGRRLRHSYAHLLDLHTYHPSHVYLISTNIKRTVESARCVMSGFFGCERLTQYTEKSGTPVKFNICDGDNTYLIPDTHNCQLLRQVNHSAMKDSDTVPAYLRDRLRLEAWIDSRRDLLIKDMEEAEKEIAQWYLREKGSRSGSDIIIGTNEFHRPRVSRPRLAPLVEGRNKIADEIPQFWSDVLCRHPTLGQHLTVEDMKLLVYLRRLEVEEIPADPRRPYSPRGHRFIFYFHNNPYFKDEALIKEVYTYDSPSNCSPLSKESKFKSHQTLANLPHSWSSPVHWKPDQIVQNSEQQKAKNMSNSERNSFFTWITQTAEENDEISRILQDEVYRNPTKYFKLDPVKSEFKQNPFNFVFTRDDCIARETHGYAFPESLVQFRPMVEHHATEMLWWAMTGQRDEDRKLVTRLSVGQLLGQFVNEADTMVRGRESDTYKLVLYSAHDSTLAALLEAVGLWQQTWPPYGSDLRLELWQDDLTGDTQGGQAGEYYVRVLYNGQPMKLRGQRTTMLPWNTFKTFMQPLTLTRGEFKNACTDAGFKALKSSMKIEEIPTTEDDDEKEAPAGM